MWILLIAQARGACPELSSLLDEAVDAFGEARVEDAGDHLREVQDALACARPSRGELVRFLHVQGAVLLLAGDEVGAGQALAASRGLDEGVPPDLGPRVAEAWAAAELSPGEPALLKLEPAYTRWRVEIDGDPARLPATLAPGLHLVQVVDEADAAHWGRLQVFRPGQTLAVDTHTPEPVVSVAPPAVPRADPGQGRAVLRWGGVGAAALGGAALALSAVQGGRIDDAPDARAVRVARDREVGWGAAGLSLVGVGAVGFGVSFAL